MPTQQALITEFVQQADGPVTSGEAAEATGVALPQTKVYLGRAVKAGLILKVVEGSYASNEYVPESTAVDEGEDLASATLPIIVEGVIAQEGIASGDGRMIERGAITWEGVLPAPLLWDRQDGDHSAMVVGSVVEVERRGDDIWSRAQLSVSDDPETQAAVARVQELFNEGAVGVSIALDDDAHELRVKRELVEEEIESLEAVQEDEGAQEAADDLKEAETDGDRVVVYKYAADDALDVTVSGRLRHVAIVDTAALLTEPDKRMAIAASGALTTSEWAGLAHFFDDPRFGEPGSDDRLRYDPGTGQWSCPVTVGEDGRVFGHVAAWGYCLRGRPDRCVTPPEGDLETFMRAYAPAAGGKRTGVICVGGGHAQTGVGAAEATRFYDNTGRAVADVRVGRDRYGIWLAGMTRPGAAKDDIYTLQASDVSGHWEPDQTTGRFRLCGLPAVNVGGFPKGLYTYRDVMDGLAASAGLEDDCGCEEPTMLDLKAQLDRLESAIAPLYATHLLGQLGDD